MAGLRAALALEGAAPRAIALRVAWCKREGLLPDVAGGVDASFALAPRGDLPARLLRILGAIQLDDAAFDALAGDGASAGTHVGGLWGALDAALVAAGASGPASGCGGVEAGWEALATPQAARTLLRAVAMREGLYPVGATIEQQAVVRPPPQPYLVSTTCGQLAEAHPDSAASGTLFTSTAAACRRQRSSWRRARQGDAGGSAGTRCG